MQTPGGIRRRGWGLIIVGASLLTIMAIMIVLVAITMLRPDEPGSTRFDGDRTMGAMVFGILGLVFLSGLTALESGIWLVRYGTRNKMLLKVTLGLWIVLMVMGLVIQYFD